MHVLFLNKYTAGGPSSRYRVLQFLPFLEVRGIRATVHALHDDHYLGLRYRGERTPASYLARRVLSRLSVLLTTPRYDLVFIQKEMFPHLLDAPEWLMARTGVRYVVDLDDAIHLMYAEAGGWRSALRNKLPRILSGASLVMAGNRYLEAYARQYCEQVLYFPTVVDTERFAPARKAGERRPPVVGWMGTPETVRYLAAIIDDLDAAAARAPVSLLVVGADAPPAGLPARARSWAEGREVADLNDMDIGLMPLADDEWSKGKCALKLLQYMSCGLASVTSPSGSAVEFVRNGENAFFASTPNEWRDRVVELARVPERRVLMGSHARAAVEAHYSLRVWGPRFADALQWAVENNAPKPAWSTGGHA